MKTRLCLVLLTLMVSGLLITPLFRTGSAQKNEGQQERPQISESAARQIQSLVNEKKSRTPQQKKIDSQLLYALKQRRGQAITNEVQTLEVDVKVDNAGQTLVDIRADVTKELIRLIEEVGGEVVYSSERTSRLRARVPLESIERLAGLKEVKSIEPAVEATTHRPRKAEAPHARPRGAALSPVKVNPKLQPWLRGNFAKRTAHVQAQLAKSLPVAAYVKEASILQDVTPNIGSVTSRGDIAHRAQEARDVFGSSGAGIKIGVLSDGVAALPQLVASGDLPPDVTVVPGQAGSGSEGTAMLEIIYDLAPSAKLFFATAFISDASFADNIRRLRFEFGCDIIVDDIIYFNESPFQDGIIARAVNDVTADGAIFFSSAGNEGNFNDGTSGTWEGDFQNGGTLPTLPPSDYTIHDFGDGNISNRIETSSTPTLFHWSDPLGGSANDYDLYLLNANLSAVLAASTGIQDGNDNPFERINTATLGARLVVARFGNAEARALHLKIFRGQLGVATDGTTVGHSAAADAFSVAAVNVAVAGNGPFTGGPTHPVEVFSADGPRRIFYNADGTPITPGNVLFGTGGGTVRQKPDIAAADGVATATPGFNPFFGTSAAAPHAAAIAGLVKSAIPILTPAEIRTALTSTALDIEAPSVDRDSGFGIVMAFQALEFIGAQPAPNLNRGAVMATPIGGDGDSFIEPGESGALSVELLNIGGATATNVSATLTTSTPGVTITQATSTYPDIPPSGSAVNTTPFTFSLAPTAPCGLPINFTLTVTYDGGGNSPQAFNFTVQTGQLSDSATFSYTGPPVPIPDGNATGVNIPFEVSGLTNIGDVNFRIDGSQCLISVGATTVGLDHSWVGDLVITLTSPQGTSVTLMNRPGGTGNSSNNFCQTLLDDEVGSPSIQNIQTAGPPPLGPPYTGTFTPASPLAAFDGQDPNGTWVLNVRDLVFTDLGNVRAFSLIITGLECDAVSVPILERGTVTATPIGGDGDSFIEPGESGALGVQVVNNGAATATNVSATLTTSTPGVTITQATSTYPDIPPSGSAVNTTPFTFSLAADAPCGLLVNFTLTLTYDGLGGPQVLNFTVQTGGLFTVNGGFETGNFTGWTTPVIPGSSGSFLVRNGTALPLSGLTTVGPRSGTFYAVDDEAGPGTHALLQTFTVPAGASSVTLSFDMFANSYAATVVDPIGLDHRSGPNQHARVDILSAGASPFDTGAGVLRNFYLGADPGSNPHPYTHYDFDITDLVAAGGTFQLRFAATNNLFFFNLGVDNVSITSGCNVSPPPTMGLTGEYYDNIDFTNLKVTRIDPTVNFDFGEGSPDPSIEPDTFSVRWTGQVQPEFSETYTFYTVSDDGVRLTVNGEVIIDNLTVHPPTEDSGTITLVAGQQYDIKMEFYENAIGAVAQLLWSSASQPKQVIPQNRLFPTAAPPVGTGLKGEYYDNIDFTNLKVTRIDPTVNFDFGEGPPDSSIEPDTFSVRWTGQVQPEFSETYTFYTVSDDGVRLTVNGEVIIDNLTDHPPTENSGVITLVAGQRYDIKMEFYENGVGAVAQLLWTSASQPRQVIPQNGLFPAN